MANRRSTCLPTWIWKPSGRELITLSGQRVTVGQASTNLVSLKHDAIRLALACRHGKPRVCLSIRDVGSRNGTFSMEKRSVPNGSCVLVGHEDLPGDGHENCPVVAMGSAQLLAITGPGWSAQWAHPLAGEGLGEAHAFAAGLADVGVVQQPVDGGGGQGLGHQLVEPAGCRLEEIAMERFS